MQLYAQTQTFIIVSLFFGLWRSTWIMAIVETISYAQLIWFQSHFDLSFHFIWSHFNDESRFFLLLSLNTRPYFVNSINKYHVQQKQKKNRLNVFFIRIYSSWNEISKHGPDDPIDNCGLIMTDDDIAWILLQSRNFAWNNSLIDFMLNINEDITKFENNLLTPFGLCRNDKHGVCVVLGPNFIVFFLSHRMQIGCASSLTQLRTMFVLTLYKFTRAP